MTSASVHRQQVYAAPHLLPYQRRCFVPHLSSDLQLYLDNNSGDGCVGEVHCAVGCCPTPLDCPSSVCRQHVSSVIECNGDRDVTIRGGFIVQPTITQKEHDNKNFFQSIRRNREPHLKSSSDGAANSSDSASRRHSFSKLCKINSRKRHKKDCVSLAVTNDLNTSSAQDNEDSITLQLGPPNDDLSCSSSPNSSVSEGRSFQAGWYTAPSTPSSACGNTSWLCLPTFSIDSKSSSDSLLFIPASVETENLDTSEEAVVNKLKESIEAKRDKATRIGKRDTTGTKRITLGRSKNKDGGTKTEAANRGGSSIVNSCQMSMLQKLAFNALNLSAPASSLLLDERRSNWVQLSGHPGSLAPAGPGTIWKKRAPESTETDMYRALMRDHSARSIVPIFFREIEYGTDYFIEMQDLLYTFNKPSLMDVKMGTRTFLEDEVANTKPRQDLYEKMVKVSPDEPTPDERALGAVTKQRYMRFRDELSSSTQLGFRVEAMKMHGSPAVTDMKKVRSRDEVLSTMTTFLRGRESARRRVLEKLVTLRDAFEKSEFFHANEVIGSSILIVYDDDKAGVWIIDFAKTRPLPKDVTVTHREPWVLGNHEEGFLYGIDNIIQVVEEVKTNKIKKLNFLRTVKGERRDTVDTNTGNK